MPSSDLDIVSGEYSYLPIEQVHFGPGSINKLGDTLDMLGSKKPFIVTGQTIARKTDLVIRVEQAARRRLAGVFSEIRQHAPQTGITQALLKVEEAKADSLISLGGGSPIDSTKIIVKELSQDFQREPLPHIAVPTTLSAAEFSHSAGMTDEKLKRKTGFRNVRMVPRSIFLDPELTIPTPGWLWASSGIRSVDHAVEAILSPKHQPLVDVLALQAIHLFFQTLKTSTQSPRDLESRLTCQIAEWMSYAGALSVGTGLSHAIGRTIGATWDIPHGITSCLTLAEVMRTHAKKDPKRLVAIAEAEGNSIKGMATSKAAQTAADGVSQLVEELGLSKRLRDYKIEKSDLPEIAHEAGSQEQYSEILAILEKIW